MQISGPVSRFPVRERVMVALLYDVSCEMMPLPLRMSVRKLCCCGSDVCHLMPVRSGSAAPACLWAPDDDETGASSQPVPEIRTSSPPFLPLYPLQLLLAPSTTLSLFICTTMSKEQGELPPAAALRSCSVTSGCELVRLPHAPRVMIATARRPQDKQRASQSRVHRRCQTISSKTSRPRSSSATMLPTRPRRSSMTCEEGGRAIRATLSVQN